MKYSQIWFCPMLFTAFVLLVSYIINYSFSLGVLYHMAAVLHLTTGVNRVSDSCLKNKKLNHSEITSLVAYCISISCE